MITTAIGFASAAAIETQPQTMASRVQTISMLPSLLSPPPPPSATPPPPPRRPRTSVNVANNICNYYCGSTAVNNSNCSSRPLLTTDNGRRVNTKQPQCHWAEEEDSRLLLPAGHRHPPRSVVHEDTAGGGAGAGSSVSVNKNWLHEGLGQSDDDRGGNDDDDDVIQLGGLESNNCNKVVHLFGQSAATARETLLVGDRPPNKVVSSGASVCEVANKLDAILSAAAHCECVREKGDAATADFIANWGFAGESKNYSDHYFGADEEGDDPSSIVGDGGCRRGGGGGRRSNNGVTNDDDDETYRAVVRLNEDAVGELRRRRRVDGHYYGRISHQRRKSSGAGDSECDCETCLDHELIRVEREIRLMIKQKQAAEQQVVAGNQQQRATQTSVNGQVQQQHVKPQQQHQQSGGHPEQQRLRSSSSSPSSAVTTARSSKSWRQLVEPGCAAGPATLEGSLSSSSRKYLCVRKSVGGLGVVAAPVVEEEFEEAGADLEPFVMVTSGAAYRGFADMPATDKYKTTSGVEGQLSALLTSGTKELPWKRHGTRTEEKGVPERRELGGVLAKRQTNLIENQLLTLEEQFWRREEFQVVDRPAEARTATTTSSASVQTALEANEGTALLLDPSQEHLMSESTPVKRATRIAAGSGTSVVIEAEGTTTGPKVSLGSATPSPNNFSRRKRFEQFLKSLVGKKTVAAPAAASEARADQDTVDGGAMTTATAGAGLKVPIVVEPRVPAGATEEGERQYEDRPIPTSSFPRQSFGSMSSLNSAVQQKFLNILPSSSAAALSTKRNLSVNNLSSISERNREEMVRTRKAMPSHHRLTAAARGLKTASCSFSNFEHLKDATKEKRGGSENGRRDGGSLEEEPGERNWRLKVSKSTNHLQSVMGGGGCGIGGNVPSRALNRFRNSLLESVSQVNIEEQCSRCSSILSLAAGTMVKVRCSDSSVESAEDEKGARRYSDDLAALVEREARRSPVVVVTTTPSPVAAAADNTNQIQSCKLCLGEVSPKQMTGINQCRCTFCTDCMKAYIEFEILEGAYEISCPDAMCPAQGVVSMAEIAELATSDLVTKHNRYRLNREVEMDKNRTWCPRAGCDTVCLMDSSNMPSSSAGPATITVLAAASSSKGALVVYAVRCPTCAEEFCSACKKTWHPRMSCEENMKRLAADGNADNIGIPFDNDLIKCCPMCGVPIEKDEGCAQMMCKRCKHVFCWYCLASLDDDFLLRHYDKGPCKNKLGHSRASVVWHRAQVIGIFAGFGLLLLVASPLLLLAAPCIVCCKCRICSGGTKIEEEHEIEFDPLTMPMTR